MTVQFRSAALLALSAAAISFAVTPGSDAHAADYPSKPVVLIVPYAPGGPTDILARAIAKGMEEKLKVAVVVDNKPGAGGNIGFQAAARAAPDGYTLVVADIPLAANKSLYESTGYDPERNFTLIGMLGRAPVVFVVPSSSPPTTMESFITYAKAQDAAGKRLTFASAGAGSPPHLFMELFSSKTGIKLEHIPYKGASPALVDVSAGRIDAMLVGATAARPLIDAGKIRPLAVTSDRRMPALPGVPTVAEAGLTDQALQMGPWWAIAGPAGLDPQIVIRVNDAIAHALASPEVREAYSRFDISMVAIAPKDMPVFLSEEIGRWQRVIRDAKITAQ